MDLHWIDIAIIAAYLLFNALIGVYIQKKATAGVGSYFLADRNVPWWMLGLSGCSSYIDIGGTMALVGAMFYLGVKCIWMTHIFWGWLMICFYMAFQAKYIRTVGRHDIRRMERYPFRRTREIAEHARIAAAIFPSHADDLQSHVYGGWDGKIRGRVSSLLARWQSPLCSSLA